MTGADDAGVAMALAPRRRPPDRAADARYFLIMMSLHLLGATPGGGVESARTPVRRCIRGLTGRNLFEGST